MTNMVANATKMFLLMTKNFGLVTTLATFNFEPFFIQTYHAQQQTFDSSQ